LCWEDKFRATMQRLWTKTLYIFRMPPINVLITFLDNLESLLAHWFFTPVFWRTWGYWKRLLLKKRLAFELALDAQDHLQDGKNSKGYFRQREQHEQSYIGMRRFQVSGEEGDEIVVMSSESCTVEPFYSPCSHQQTPSNSWKTGKQS
jgi:hypothetical protein